MSLDTYATLQTSIANWMHRADLVSYIPDFIRLCEAEFNRKFRLRAMENREAFTADSEYEDLPTGYKEMRVVQITGDDGRELTYMPPSEFRFKYRGAIGKPYHYTIIGSQIQFGPAPNSEYPMEWVFYTRIPALSDSQTTNWVLTNHPDVYLYGSLTAAEPFIKNDARFPLWKSLYDQAAMEVIGEDVQSKFTGPLVQRIVA